MVISMSTAARAVRPWFALGVLAAATAATGSARAADEFDFRLQKTLGLPPACAPHARASAHLETVGFAERLRITVSGFNPGTPLVLFALQVPNAPFGVGWYLSDLPVGAGGGVTRMFTTRLNNETFAVAVGSAVAPRPHGNRDNGSNPTFKPVHTFHLGIWSTPSRRAPQMAVPAGRPRSTATTRPASRC